MDQKKFWELIALLNWKEEGDDDGVVKPAVDHLASHAEEEIKRFEDILAEKLFALDTRAHAKAAFGTDEGFSGDEFLYVRCCIVANGEAFYRNVLNDPSHTPKDMEFEALLYLASAAWQKATGAEFDYHAPTDYETLSNAAGWDGE